ncbi:hypothetical protein NM688_g3483 [Phlebia brevispora]|uniref:Uncharacterized protein n=1 Tax=Phlebia brevispora TaxID=194682 RepID=A0ACC1T5S2_9APHY|nr:hypothetical protein NM688_g3483 [Phlebia brevispora]
MSKKLSLIKLIEGNYEEWAFIIAQKAQDSADEEDEGGKTLAKFGWCYVTSITLTKLKSETIIAYITPVCKAAYELSHTSALVSKLDMIFIIIDELSQKYSIVVTILDDLPFDKLKMMNVIMCIAGQEVQL